MTKSTLKKDERLKSKKIIGHLFQSGDHFFKYPLKWVYLPVEKSKKSVLFSVSVSKRFFKHAVDRNRIKRKVREAYRLQKDVLLPSLADSDQSYAVMVIYVAKEDIAYTRIAKSLESVMLEMKKKFV